MWRWYIFPVLLLCLVAPAAAQDGRGLIVEANLSGADSIETLNPLLCRSDGCRQLTSLLFPTLLAVDPSSGQIIPAGPGDYALASAWEVEGDTLRFTIRDDLRWSNGEAISAADVIFSYYAAQTPEVNSPYGGPLRDMVFDMAWPEPQTVEVNLREGIGCFGFDQINLPIIPAHRFLPDVPQGLSDPQALMSAFLTDAAALQEGTVILNHPFNDSPDATAGPYELVELRPLDFVRLSAADGQRSYEYRDVAGRQSEFQMLMNGSLNYDLNPPFVQRDDLRLNVDLHSYEAPGLDWYAVGFNLSDDHNPLPGYDEAGQRIEQPPHPILADLRVRQAIRIALDVPTLIEAALQGNGTVLTGTQIPASWAFDDSTALPEHDPFAAAQLLQTAGWKNIGSDSIRECLGCLYAEQGTRLALDMYYDSTDPVSVVVFRLMAEQLRRIGIELRPGELSGDQLFESIWRQRFDLYLYKHSEAYPVSPDRFDWLSASHDGLRSGLNGGSYYNAEVEALYQEARSAANCDYATRAALYQEIDTILAEDLPLLPLFVVNDMLIVKAGISGPDPVAGWPLWNVEEWVIQG